MPESKVMYVWRLSDTASTITQLLTLFQNPTDTNFMSICDSEHPRTNVGASPSLHTGISNVDIKSAKRLPLASSLGIPHVLGIEVPRCNDWELR